jgi:hypothetical protein
MRPSIVENAVWWRWTMKKDERIRIELTDEQKKQLKQSTGKDVKVLEFTAEELESRIAPLYFAK